MKSRMLLNPSSGRGRGGRALASLARLCQRHGIAIEESGSADDLARRARRAADEGVERLLVAGGDGTWHWAAQGLAGSECALAPIPLGTGNDLARELGYPLDAERAFAAALAGARDRIDLGRIGERYFCGVAGVGFDAAVAEYARTRVRRLRGPIVYAWATLASLATYRPPNVRLSSDGGDFEGPVFLVAFANTSHYGGGMRIAPSADPRDGRLDVVVLTRTSKGRLLRVFPKVYRGAHVDDPSVRIFRATVAEVSFDAEQLVNADGEFAGRVADAALQFSVAPAALAVFRAPH
jgi:diacylglycerol kinase (ATP)